MTTSPGLHQLYSISTQFIMAPHLQVYITYIPYQPNLSWHPTPRSTSPLFHSNPLPQPQDYATFIPSQPHFPTRHPTRRTTSPLFHLNPTSPPGTPPQVYIIFIPSQPHFSHPKVYITFIIYSVSPPLSPPVGLHSISTPLPHPQDRPCLGCT